MIKLKYEDLNNKDLVKSFQEIKLTQLPFTASYRVNRIAAKLDTKISEFQKRYIDFIKEYAKKDENGKIVDRKDENGVVLGFEPSDKELADKKYAELLSEEFEIDVNKIEASDLVRATISPATLFHLKPFINGLDELDGV